MIQREDIPVEIKERFYGNQVQVYVPAEWMPQIELLNKDLAEIDPEYEIVQIKSKWGQLCFYFKPTDNIDLDNHQMMIQIVEEYEAVIGG